MTAPRVVAVIQARMGSQRLPGKVLREVDGRPLLSYMLERVAAAKTLELAGLATSDAPQDDPIAGFARASGLAIVRGSEEDVLSRFVLAAREFRADVVVRLTGDCPLIDPRVIDEVVTDFLRGGADYVANTCPPVGTFPDGMDVEVFSREALERAGREAIRPSDREHVTFYLWKEPGRFRTRRVDRPASLSGLRLTVDTPKDFELVKHVLRELRPKGPLFSMQDIVDLMARRPDLRSLNEGTGWNQGWASAREKDRAAGFGPDGAA